MLKGKGVFVLLCCALFLFATAGLSWAAGKLPDGFVAMSDKEMTYAKAEAFCKQKKGKLPRINNSDLWDLKGASGVPIDGFGAGYGPWPDGVPSKYGLDLYTFWTGTRVENDPKRVWTLRFRDGDVGISDWIETGVQHVICVK